MDSFTSGLLLILIGVFLGVLTLKKYKFFWELINTRLLRKWIGDSNTLIALYTVSVIFIVTGFLLSLNLIK